jgi:peptidoglycan/LPS O-acetylase OafA/YrhL
MTPRNIIVFTPLKRILGIDQLRYVFALWVFFTHGGAPPLFNGHSSGNIFDGLDKLYGWSINGEAAVMCFFIISGLCIHFPNLKKDKVDILSFYTARFLRLSLPVFACLGIAILLNYKHEQGLLRSVPIWTLYCEAIYYCIYPFVFILAKKGHLLKTVYFFLTITLILCVYWYDVRTMPFHEVGAGGVLSWKAALLAFPLWLLGCLIAEIISTESSVKKEISIRNNLFRWRIAAVLLSMIPTPLYRIGLYYGYIKSPIVGLLFSTQLTLILFGIFAFFWIKKEVIYANFGTQKVNDRLERFGLASYSLYIVHTLVLWMGEKMEAYFFPGYLIYWISLFITLHLVTYFFYIIIEKPSHKIARYFAMKLK